MAAEQGGNCELCRPGEIALHDGVAIIGFTDLPSRMAATASRFFAMNVFHLLSELASRKHDTIAVDLTNDVVHPATLLFEGSAPPPMAQKPVVAAEKPPAQPPRADLKPKQQEIMRPTRVAWGTTAGGLVAIITLFVLGRFAPPDLLQHSTVFVLACFVGWQVVWSVTPALHTPLMSVTNAISGIIIIGGVLQVGATVSAATLLAIAAVFLAAINVSGGFAVTSRMLKMFRRDGDRP
jgi:NAD(P) transhydrogenase subunit alpha